MNEIEKIKALREATGLSFAQIKKALDEAGGDAAKAVEVLKSYGASIAAKKSSREMGEGIIDSYIHSTKKIGALVELLCETDFVARNSEFQAMAHDIAMHIVAMRPADEAELLSQAFVKDPSVTIKDVVNGAIAKLGENIRIGKFTIFEL
ncbi:MAG: elongation factor Ts [Patescibacteria group bacterium]